MNRREDFAIETIDRSKERASSRDARSARSKALDARAASLIGTHLAAIPDHERADYAEKLVIASRIHLVIHQGEASAAAILSREAYEAGRNLMPRTDARDKAGQAFK
jgi:hypothetical protein